MITKKQLVLLGVPEDTASTWLGPLAAVTAMYDISTPRRQAAFLAQVLHESRNLTRVEENLNYSSAALLTTFNTKNTIRFTPTLARQFGRTDDHPANPRMIANIAYADRMGNGPVSSGDGWRYRGRGPIQLTGRNNYLACGEGIGLDLISDPDALLRPGPGASAAGWFWARGNRTGRSLNALADTGQIDKVSQAVNGGDHGLDKRRALYEKALQVMA